MKKPSIVLFAAFVLSACTKPQLPVADYDIIPQPKEVQLNEEKPFELGPKTLVYYESGLQREAQFLSEYVNDIMGYALKMQEYQGQSDGILMKVVPEDFDQSEAYEIDITPKQVAIKGADAAGVFYGIQTLRKSLPVSQLTTLNSQLTLNSKPSTLNFQLPCGTIKDYPNFAYRGMHLDPCRHFMDLDSVKIYLDMMALHNMNQFHFHLSEDQG
jgi:hexosaminidase